MMERQLRWTRKASREHLGLLKLEFPILQLLKLLILSSY